MTKIAFYYNGFKIDGGDLQKVNYYLNEGKDAGGPSVSMTAKGGSSLPHDLFKVRNDTDLYTDYFDNDHTVVTPDHPLYKHIRAAATKDAIRSIEKHIQWLDKYIAAGSRNADAYKEEQARDKARIQKLQKWMNRFAPKGHPTEDEVQAAINWKQAIKLAAEQARKEAEERERAAYDNAMAEQSAVAQEMLAADVLKDGDAYVVIHWSEHPGFDGYEEESVGEKRISVQTMDKLLDRLDHMYKALGYGYCKTKLTVHTADGDEYTMRYDIGDCDGGIIAHIRSFAAYVKNHENMGGPEQAEAMETFADKIDYTAAPAYEVLGVDPDAVVNMALGELKSALEGKATDMSPRTMEFLQELLSIGGR